MLQDCLNQLAQHQLRRTKNREALLTVLHQADAPLSSPDIVLACHRIGRRANKTTIYRDLEAMEKIGIVRKVVVSDRKQYFELTERGHHHHFVCVQCDSVRDIAIEDGGLLAQAKALGKKLHFAIEEHAVEFYGRCQACQVK